jgi:predicted component of type VI protein secretion system
MARLSGTEPPRDIGEAIAGNLSDVLNSRKPFGAFQPMLGLGDFHQRESTKGATEVLRHELLENIRALEPRLQNPSARRIGQDPDFWLHYEVDGRAEGKPLRLLVSFQTTMGGVRVKVLP